MPVEFPISANLLKWYDRHARILPWRSPPGHPPPDPYRVWLSEIMLQQTTVAAVKPYFAAFTARWPDVVALAAADDANLMAAWAGLGYYARARNLLACARVVVRDHAGRFPPTEAELRTLPGVGAYTAAAIAAIAFGQRAVVVDGNVERVVARLFAVETPLPRARPELVRLTATITPDTRCGDFAQALMDLGSSLCTPRRADCLLCPLRDDCAGRSRDPLGFPRRLPKSVKPERTGTVWWITRGDQVLLVRRPQTGLLGGMRALPGWDGDHPLPPLAGRLLPEPVVHVFTHFRLTLDIWIADASADCQGLPDGEWWPIDQIEQAGLPSAFAKVAALVAEEG